MAVTLPTILGPSGAQPTPLTTLNAEVIAAAVSIAPGLTATLPGSLVEDMSSTATGAVSICDQSYVDLLNSVTPYGANTPILYALGQCTGIVQGQATNTSVFVVFSGTPGFVIPIGFTVGDGTYQYQCIDGGIIGAGGASPEIFAVATVTGSWAVPINSVTTLITSVPSGVTLSVTNPVVGTPSSGAETISAYRARVLQAMQATAQGMPTFLRSLIQAVPGVQPSLVSIQQQSGGWMVMSSGGDPYLTANAIFTGLFDINQLVGSTLGVTAINNATPSVVTTNLTHGLTTGAVIQITGAGGVTNVNGVSITATVLTPYTFSIGFTATGTYTSGGVVTPNLRNQVVSINNYPDTYQVTYVTPLQQAVTINVNWHSISPNFIASASVAAVVQPAIVNYVNSITVGQPINIYQMQTIFQAAVAAFLPASYISTLTFTVIFAGTTLSPTNGIVTGDPQSYWFTTAANVVVTQV